MKFIECPRDAMQGIGTFIPTYKKISYINKLLQVGFDTIDVGSFVSKNAIPQMVDTEEVIKGINITNSNSKLKIGSLNYRPNEIWNMQANNKFITSTVLFPAYL